MLRLFQEHMIRKQQELEGMWEFIKADGGHYTLSVPGCWEQHPLLNDYRGKGTYYRRIFVTEPCNLRLVFKGVSHTADVWLDDTYVMHHYNAYTPFCGVVRSVAPGEHLLKVEVDNSFSEQSTLHRPNDYYSYGGISRPVGLEQIGNVYIENMHMTPIWENDSWSAVIETRVVNMGEETDRFTIRGSLSERLDASQNEDEGCYLIEAQSCVLSAGEEKTLRWEQAFDGVKSWNPDAPVLYFLQLRLEKDGQAFDDLIDRVGFRTVSLMGRRLCVNGEPVFLKGFNRHEDYGEIGCAIPPQLMAQDLDLMQDMGANAVRTCHYPNDERFLDMCDERGILVWEENHSRGFREWLLENPLFEKQCHDCVEEMIEYHFNHPSIVIWGILNEYGSDHPEARELYEKLYSQIKDLDRTRPTTSATCKHFKDLRLELPDMVSFNLYSGWYEDDNVRERHDRVMEWIGQAGGAGKPVIVSEFGGGAVYGFRDRRRSKWSEERQADILLENLEVYMNDPRLTGVFIWQFADCRVTEEEWFAARPRSYNNKGVVDEYRRPKGACDIVRRLYRGQGREQRRN
ncbi:MAG: hypothetical protein LUE16_02055 [Lachnospiraceae bacterium]|nr:hypothetical protein [Lachnospiraceae bacterium]